jgi:hypothetical protein
MFDQNIKGLDRVIVPGRPFAVKMDLNHRSRETIEISETTSKGFLKTAMRAFPRPAFLIPEFYIARYGYRFLR